MNLDTATLMVVGSFATALSSLVLIGSWATYLRKEHALLWWAAANFAYALGIALILYGSVGNTGIVVVGVSLTSFTPALVWAGVRRFERRSVIWLALFAGVVLWFVVGVATADGDGPSIPGTFVALANWTVYLTLAVWELWRGRAEDLPARVPLMVLFVIHAAVYIGGMSDVVSGSFIEDGSPPLDSWFGVIYFEGIIYAMGTALFMVVLGKERGERRYIIAGRSDSLTGINNRGAFLEHAERTLLRCRRDGMPVSFVMFDLDRFKWINDTFGHATGDRVLRAFADTTRGVLRPGDLFGRYGGEEFAVMLPGATVDVAFVIAERVRHNFAEACAS